MPIRPGLARDRRPVFHGAMCGRYSLTSPVEAVREVFGFLERPNLAPRYNVAPTQLVAAVRLGDDGARHLVMLRWGLVPSWAKDPAIGNRMINARAESLTDKPAFRSAARRRRCLVVADGFYEWRKEPAGKQPYRIAMAEAGPFAFAGLWERWRDRAAERDLESCTIVTTDANARLRPIHERMPVILSPADFDAWLRPETPLAEATALLRPYRDDPAQDYGAMVAYPVSRRVNAVANDDPGLIEPLPGDVGGPTQPTLL